MQTSRAEPLLPSDLGGRRAVVTGAARGIGYAIALRLAQAGAQVLALDIDKLHLVRRLRGPEWRGLDCTPIEADLGEDPEVDPVSLAQSLVEGQAPVELIVNNVGICTGTGYWDTPPDAFDLVMRTNFRNPWFFTKRLVESLVENDRPGSVLFISSLHSKVPSYRPQYDLAKAAVSQATRALAAELGPRGIRVNAISPGWIDTASIRNGVTAAKVTRMTPVVPLRRAGSADDIASVAVFLLSDACAGYVTGADVPVDGGLRLHTWVPAP
jgi:glucose 1-dehydrogenase